MREIREKSVGMTLAQPLLMKRFALLFGAASVIACNRQEPPHTADDSSWVRPQPALAGTTKPAEKAAELQQALSEQPNPWAPPKTSDAVAPTSMNKPPPATEALEGPRPEPL